MGGGTPGITPSPNHAKITAVLSNTAVIYPTRVYNPYPWVRCARGCGVHGYGYSSARTHPRVNPCYTLFVQFHKHLGLEFYSPKSA